MGAGVPARIRRLGTVAVALELPIPDDMDLNKFLGSDSGQDFFSGAWDGSP